MKNSDYRKSYPQPSSIDCVMAAGRGEFFQSFVEGLERIPAQLASRRRQPGRGGGKPGPGRGQAAPRSVRGNELR